MENKDIIPWVSRPEFEIELASGRILDTAPRCLVMGILNVTPDSFSDGGDYFGVERAVKRARRMAADGADIIDVGGESTRPGSRPVAPEAEKRRVVPVVKQIAAECDVPVSVDTQKSTVAEAALEAGAEIINDVSAMRTDEEMASLMASSGAGVCLMHMQGRPENMQQNPSYDDVVDDIKYWLEKRVEVFLKAGGVAERVIVDPGFGFGKRARHNLEIVRRLREFHSLGYPLLLGASRKTTIGEVLDKPVDGRLYGSLAVAACAVMSGVQILRVHDVKATREVVDMTENIIRKI